jgi:hypothetical protein
MYCSNSVSVHLLRGVAALGLIIGAVLVSAYGLLWSILPAFGAIVLLRGCPMCWLMGLIETLAQRRNRNL